MSMLQNPASERDKKKKANNIKPNIENGDSENYDTAGWVINSSICYVYCRDKFLLLFLDILKRIQTK